VDGAASIWSPPHGLAAWSKSGLSLESYLRSILRSAAISRPVVDGRCPARSLINLIMDHAGKRARSVVSSPCPTVLSLSAAPNITSPQPCLRIWLPEKALTCRARHRRSPYGRTSILTFSLNAATRTRTWPRPARTCLSEFSMDPIHAPTGLLIAYFSHSRTCPSHNNSFFAPNIYNRYLPLTRVPAESRRSALPEVPSELLPEVRSSFGTGIAPALTSSFPSPFRTLTSSPYPVTLAATRFSGLPSKAGTE
jgi:hypothetical protein